mmetsp:Transcript_5517/g.13827  ORF Transcript_5517/g.13827 Transcript_5517/m.13827 type:complete len:400 (+) Transcript_5517:172-1371(+)
MSITPPTACSGHNARSPSASTSSGRGVEKMTSVVTMPVVGSSGIMTALAPVMPRSLSLSISGGPSIIESRGLAMCPVGKSSLSAADNEAISGCSNDIKPTDVRSSVPSASHGQARGSGSISFRKGRGRVALPRSRKCSSISGRWTASEHQAFLQGLKVYGREWKKVAICIPTRTSAQIRSHAQKYFSKVSKEQQQLLEIRRFSIPDAMPWKSDESALLTDPPMTQSFVDTMTSMVENPSEVKIRVSKTLASLRERYKHLEDKLDQVKVSAASIQSAETSLGPATAALALEQKSMRKAAEARYEMKKFDAHLDKEQSSPEAEARDASYACVSLSSMPPHSDFDSNDVIALSILGGNFGRESMENKTISTVQDDNSLKLVCGRPQLIGHERPTKLRKVNEP